MSDGMRVDFFCPVCGRGFDSCVCEEDEEEELKGWYYNEEAFGYSTIKKEN
jgi:hypothetical protein